MMSEKQISFLTELVRHFDPRLCNTDVQDVADSLRIDLADAEILAAELAILGCIKTIGLGGNIAPTELGRKIAAGVRPEK